MRGLLEGHTRFKSVYFGNEGSLLKRLAEEGQRPEALVICCSDSRVAPELILGASPGQLFVLRNVGNIVPSRGTGNESTAAALEYALEHLGVRHIVVLGHYGCGAIRAIAESAGLIPEDATHAPHPTPAGIAHPGGPGMTPIERRGWFSTPLHRWLDADRDLSRRAAQSLKAGTPPEQLLDRMSEENVLVQMEHILGYAPIKQRLRGPSLELHGWCYAMNTGELFLYDPESRRFVPASARAAGVAG